MKTVNISDISIKRTGVAKCPYCVLATPIPEMEFNAKIAFCLHCRQPFEIIAPKSKIDPKLYEKLRRAIEERRKASVEWAKSLDDLDCIEAVDLIKEVTKTENHLMKVMRML